MPVKANILASLLLTLWVQDIWEEPAAVLSLSDQETLPSTRALDLLALGYRNLAADYYWLHSLNEFGTTELHEHHYPNLGPYLERTLHLDPYFAGAYLFAGSALGFRGMDIDLAIRLLRQGAEKRPEQWQISFLLGFHLYERFGDYTGALVALKKAAAIEGSAPFLPALITRMSAHAGEPEVGLEFIGRLIESTEDEKLREEYIERQKVLLTEYHLKHLNRALEIYEQRYGHRASNVEALAEAGLVSGIPDEPLGGHWLLGEDGRLTTSSDFTPLRLYGKPKAPKTDTGAIENTPGNQNLQ